MTTLTFGDLKSAAERLCDARVRRDMLILRAKEEGKTVRFIAEATGLSPGGVQRIITRQRTTGLSTRTVQSITRQHRQ